MPNCWSEYSGDHWVPVRNSTSGTTRKNAKDSVRSTATIPTIVRTDTRPQKSSPAWITPSPTRRPARRRRSGAAFGIHGPVAGSVISRAAGPLEGREVLAVSLIRQGYVADLGNERGGVLHPEA